MGKVRKLLLGDLAVVPLCCPKSFRKRLRLKWIVGRLLVRNKTDCGRHLSCRSLDRIDDGASSPGNSVKTRLFVMNYPLQQCTQYDVRTNGILKRNHISNKQQQYHLDAVTEPSRSDASIGTVLVQPIFCSMFKYFRRLDRPATILLTSNGHCLGLPSDVHY